MKAQKLLLTAGLTASMLGMWSCSSDDGWGAVDDKAPTMALATDHYKGAVGRQIPIKATITDADGIAKINLKCSALFINKTIDIIDIYGEPLKSYDLNYNFPVAKEETGDNFQIEVTVTDVVGNETKQTLTVTMDGDFEAPVFASAPGSEVTVIMKARTSYTVNVSCTDDQNLDYLEVKWEGLSGQETPIKATMSGKSGNYSEKFTLPNEEATYNLTLTVVDKEGKSSTKKSTISVSSNVPDYPNLWLADVATTAELNSDIFGVPMYVGHAFEGEKPVPYTYEARYYNAKAGTKIKFLGQKNDFGPVCYGCDATDANLLSDDEEAMKDITLDKAGVYYRITFNIKTYEMKTETYSVTDAKAAWRTELYDKPETFLVWDQWYINFQLGYLSGGPADVIAFKQDATNPNLFYLEEPMTFDDANNLKANDDGSFTTNFMIHNFHPGGWWDVVAYKPNNAKEPEYWPFWGNFSQEQLNTPDWTEWLNQPKGPNDWCKAPVPSSKFGNYKLIFDAHLEQAKLVPAN